jgi:hypothetical protein
VKLRLNGKVNVISYMMTLLTAPVLVVAATSVSRSSGSSDFPRSNVFSSSMTAGSD